MFSTEDNSYRTHQAFKERWIRYDAADEILRAAGRLMNMPKKSRMPNLLIIGDTNNGKTSILNRLLRCYPVDENTDGEARILPIVKIQAPADADEGRLYDLILKEFKAPSAPSYRPIVKYNQIITIAPVVNLKCLLIDEIHDILAGSRAKQRILRCAIRQLGTALQVPIIGAGTTEALNAVKSDPQLSNRFTPVFIPKWRFLHLEDRTKEPFLRFLSSFQKTLLLRKKSNLTSPDISNRLMMMCDGLVGELVSILSLATEEAISTGVEEINLDVLDKIYWIPPSKRGDSAPGF